MTELTRRTPLRNALDEDGRRQSWLADQLGVSKALVCLWCSGDKPVANKYRSEIARLLRRNERDLFSQSRRVHRTANLKGRRS